MASLSSEFCKITCMMKHTEIAMVHWCLLNSKRKISACSGFDNLGIAWQLTDFQETDVESMMDDLLEELRPFYEQLHSFVRQRLILAYPDQKIDPQGPIPVHLLGLRSTLHHRHHRHHHHHRHRHHHHHHHHHRHYCHHHHHHHPCRCQHHWFWKRHLIPG